MMTKMKSNALDKKQISLSLFDNIILSSLIIKEKPRVQNIASLFLPIPFHSSYYKQKLRLEYTKGKVL
jgi:hypothetical protein